MSAPHRHLVPWKWSCLAAIGGLLLAFPGCGSAWPHYWFDFWYGLTASSLLRGLIAAQQLT